MTLTASRTIASGVHEYARSVVRGEIVTGKLVRLACERHLRDLEESLDPDRERGIHFSENHAEHALRFFGFLTQTDGRWKGEPLKLEPWQVFIIGSVFGWLRDDGTRRFRTAYTEVARKNGKSLIGAGVALYMAFFDGEGRSEVYSAATTRDQAKIVFEAGKRLLSGLPPEIKAGISPLRHSIYNDEGSTFKPLSSDYGSLDGLNVHAAIVDEVHAHKTRDLIDVLKTGTGARTQPLLYYITTAGYDRHSACWEEHVYSERILTGVDENDAYFCYIAAMDQGEKDGDGDDWKDEANWIKANPNLGVSVTLENLREECAEALSSPTKENAFRNKRLNEWTQQAVRWMSMEAWDACAGEIDLEALRGRACFAGVDLSTKVDISALVLLFPPRDGEDVWICLPYFWVPAENIRKRAERDRVPYDRWRDQGYIFATEGSVVDFRAIQNKIASLSADDGFKIQQVAFDPWNATQFSTDLQEMGFQVIEVRQGARSLSEPLKLIEALVLEKKLNHGGNPPLRWMASNMSVRTDPNENIAPDKKTSTERIDGIVALADAFSRAIVEVETGPSIYESRGVLVI